MDAPELLPGEQVSESPRALIEKIITHQRQAEISFCACVFMGENVAEQFGWLSPDKFRDIGAREYWAKCITGLEPTKAAIDCGIMARLVGQMNDLMLTPSQAEAFAQTISDDCFLVSVCQKNDQLATKLFKRDTAEAMAIIQAMAQEIPANAREYPTAVDAHLDFVSGLDDDPQVIYTGIPNLDTALGGFERGTLNILAARPSMGKSAGGYQIAEYNADHAYTALYISLEMKRRQLWMRRACGIAEIDSRLYKARRLTDEQKEQLIRISNELVDKYAERLVIIDAVPQDVKSIWQAVAEVRPDILIVDHLGLVARPGDNDVTELGALTWGLKMMAKQFNCAALVLYQLSRSNTKRDNKRPVMADLRGSGMIEENADTISFLHRDDYYEDPQPGQIVSPTEWIVDKNRDGVRNIRVKLEYHLKRQLFYAQATQPNAQRPGMAR